MAKANQATVTGRFTGGAIFEPKTIKRDSGDSEECNACVALHAGEEAKVEAAIEAAIAEKWGKRPPGLVVYGPQYGDDPEYATYEKHFINPKKKNSGAPSVLRKTSDGVYEKVTRDSGVIYPGCDVAISVDAYGFDADPKRGIKKPGVSLGLRAVMFLADGESLSSARVNAEDEFGDVNVPDEDDFLGDAA